MDDFRHIGNTMVMYFIFLLGCLVGGMCTVLDAKKNGVEKAIVNLFVVTFISIVSFSIWKLWLPEKWFYYMLIGNLILLSVITDRLTPFIEKSLRRMHIEIFPSDNGKADRSEPAKTEGSKISGEEGGA